MVKGSFPSSTSGKNLSVSAGDTRDMSIMAEHVDIG